ncbi:MAG: linear amide C-N hydrolase [Gemmatimonadaceae bacterium]|nr:linear amide C-N hydrolase [Gemmatimonadaceae bacterium]
MPQGQKLRGKQRSVKMKRLAFVGILPVTAIILAAFVPLFNAEACTRMFWNTNGQVMLVGRNMDLDLDDQPVFYVFPMGISKNGGTDVNPATWTSQYGSVVVTAWGKSTFSFEGINTAGLGFHGLYLGPTQFENRDSRPGVLQGRYGEYLLDNAATVSDALQLMSQTQLVPELLAGTPVPQHYAIEDASGDSAVIEFVGGQMNVYHGAEYTILTNDPPFDQQMPNLWHYQYFGGDDPLPGDCNPTARFVRASAFLSTLNGASSYAAIKTNPISTMFLAIRSMSEPFGALQFMPGVSAPIPAWPTLWTIVSDLANKAVYFTHNVARNNFWIDMRKLNFQEGAPIRSLKADRPDLAGEVSSFFTSPSPAMPSLLLSD